MDGKMNICETCKWWDEEMQDWGVCLLSKTDNNFMIASDEIAAYDPYLETHKTFGCNQHRDK